MSKSTDATNEDARIVLIAQNPRSGSSNRGRLVQSLAQELIRNGMEVKVIQDIDELVLQAEKLLASRELRTVVSAGGDGTVSLLVNRLPAEVPFFVFPLGTANLLANYLKINRDIDQAVATIVNCKTVMLDVGLSLIHI